MSFVKFDHVNDWGHLQLSNELFQQKHKEAIMKFWGEVKNLKDEYNACLLALDLQAQVISNNQEERRENNKAVLHQMKQEKSRAQHLITKAAHEAEKIEEAIILSKDRLQEVVLERDDLTERRKAFVGEIKKTYSAFINAKDYFKVHLKMYFTIESAPGSDSTNIMVEFFTSSKLSKPYNAVCLTRSNSDRKYRLISTTPQLSVLPELQRRLQKTGDVRGLLCCVRSCFIKLHNITNKH